MRIDEVEKVLSEFKNYWELYSYVKTEFSSQYEFNEAMWKLRPQYLELLEQKRTN
jgi:hypothetical protein